MLTANPIKILLLIIGLSLATPAPAEARIRHHHKVHKAPSLVDRSASYADIVIDAESGQVLHATNPDSLRHPASLTKMLTLYLTFQAIEQGRLGLNQYMTISSNAAEQPPSKLGLRPGDRIRVEDAILGLVTESANDAAVVIAETLGGSEEGFGQIMTRQARTLGMTRSRFDNPSGLPDPDQVTTARDMAILGRALIYNFPQYYSYFSHDSFTYAGIYHHNHNHLMSRYDGMDGIKTGYIRASGFNLVASAKRDGKRLIGVVFGGHSTLTRDNRMAQLLDDAFDTDRGGAVVASSGTQRLAGVATVAMPPPEPQGDAADDQDSYAKPVRTASIAPLAKPQPAAPAPVAKVAARPAPKHAARNNDGESGGSWGVQIGAYGDPAVGQQALANAVSALPQYLSGADPVIQKISSGGVTMYRARLMAMDKQSATEACSILAQHGQSCLTVGP